MNEVLLNALEHVPLESLGLLGQYHSLIDSRPSPLEICRYSRGNEQICNEIIILIREPLSRAQKRQFGLMFGERGDHRQMMDRIIREIEEDTTDNRMTGSSTRRLLKVGSPHPQLREYQIECKEYIREAVKTSESSLLVMPTGAGKTRTAMMGLREFIENSEPPIHVLWIVHSEELCEQAEHAFESVWTDNRDIVHHPNLWLNIVYGSGMKPRAELYNDGKPSFTIATPDSIDYWEEGAPCEFDVIVVDEAHHGIEEQINRVFDKLPHKHKLGLTATPELTSDRRLFAKTYRNLIYPNEYLRDSNQNMLKEIMMEDGYLSNYEIIKKRIGDEASEFIIRDEFLIDNVWYEQPAAFAVIIRLALEMMNGGVTKLLIFCERIPQCNVLVSILRDLNIRAEALHSDVPRYIRRSIITEFNAGETQVLISVNILREGVDMPSVNGIILARRNLTNDQPMFTQMIGRGLRGPRCDGGTEYCTIYHLVN